MRIAIINYTAGGMCGGYRQYLKNVIPRIIGCPSVDSILCASPPSLNVQDWLEPLSNVKIVTCRPYRFMVHKPDPELNKHLKEFAPDVIFVPLERLMKFNNIPVVNMVKNMAPFMPVANNLFREKLRYLALIAEARIALRRSKRIIAISDSVRSHLIEKWKIPADHIGLVYHGCDMPDGKKTVWQKPASVPEEWKGRFLFTAGSIEPYRGLEDLLHAFKYMTSQNVDLKGVVIAGEARKHMMKYWNRLKQWIRKNNLTEKICWTGRLHQDEMAWCYNNCRVFVMTSRVEAFGLIGVEAMSYGCISVVADNPCLPEIFDKAATFYKPYSGEDLANKIIKVLSWDPAKLLRASETARQHASEFSWDRTAEQTVNELKIASGISRVIILGLNVYHGDSSACIVIDGKLIAAVEEERFKRIKHWAGFPESAIEFCLKEANITIEEVDHIAINRRPKVHFLKKAAFALSTLSSYRSVYNQLRNLFKVQNVRNLISGHFAKNRKIRAQFHSVEHHVAHSASAFFVSPFDNAAVVSIDGFGDFVSTMWGVGRGNKIEVKHRTFFPHSLGHFYLALTQYLGFSKYGDEYKVMGLAAYGKPRFMDAMRKIVRTTNNGFELDLDCFVHHSIGFNMDWDNGEPSIGVLYSPNLESLLGPARKSGEDIKEKHRDIAASLQKRYEEVFFHVLNQAHNRTKSQYLALAGGCAMNSVANGKIFEQTPFRDVYIQPAGGDAGGAIGAAYYVWHHNLGKPRDFVLDQPYLGPKFSEEEISKQLSVNSEHIEKENCSVEKILNAEDLCKKTAECIVEGKVVGWFQGKMEWGPRALGNRSILCDPRRSDMKDILNLKIKRRESFRPFAPSIHIEATGEYFETSSPVPFMLKAYSIKPEKREVIPAVTHVDGTGRLQTVSKENNALYWMLIDEFRKITGVPVVLNTSFNENEPIVCRPEEALNCFLKTNMDVLVLGSFLVKRLN